MTAYHDIIDGIARGDAIGGPTALSEIVAESLIANDGLDIADINNRYHEWWRSGSFDTGPTYDLVFKHIDGGMEPSAAVEAAHADLGTAAITGVRQASSRQLSEADLKALTAASSLGIYQPNQFPQQPLCAASRRS